MRPTNNGNGNGHKESPPEGGGAVDHKLLLATLLAVKKGDFAARMPVDHVGVAGKIYDTLNDIIELEQRTATELGRMSQLVGKEGKINQRASIGGAGGAWQARIEHLNGLIADLLQPTAEVARVIGAVAKGDLSQTMALEIEGRPLKGEFMRTA